MKIKICGMKHWSNIEQLLNLKPDFIGFIFYEKSPRYIDDKTLALKIGSIDPAVKKVGVFVNHSIDRIKSLVTSYQLDYVQLHGDESIQYVKTVQSSGIKIMKAFQINAKFDWSIIEKYEPFVDYFLFDNATKNYGGSGQKFDWKYLFNYKSKKPFLLSGGITLDDIAAIKAMNHSQLLGVDMNSKLEIEPGKKDIKLAEQCIKQCRL